MNNPSVDSPQYERRTRRNFVITLAIALVAGVLLGIGLLLLCSMVLPAFAQHQGDISQALSWAQQTVLPVALLIFVAAMAIPCQIWLGQCRRQIPKWDGEDENYIAAVDKTLTRVMTLTNVCFVGSFLLFSMITYNMTGQEITGFGWLLSIVVFMAGLLLSAHQQSRAVKLVQQYAPEKRGSVYDRKFQSVWLESCDESEKYRIYTASYRTMQKMNRILAVVFAAVTILGMFFPIGFLCALIVGGIYLVQTLLYSREAYRLEYGEKS